MAPPAGHQAVMSDLSRTIGRRAFGCPVGARLMPSSVGHRPGAAVDGTVERNVPAKRWIAAMAMAGPMGQAQECRVRAPPHPPVRIARWDSIVPVASNPIRFSKPVPFSGRAGRIFPPRNSPLLLRSTGTRQKICHRGYRSYAVGTRPPQPIAPAWMHDAGIQNLAL
jgi:hypothetical protein